MSFYERAIAKKALQALRAGDSRSCPSESEAAQHEGSEAPSGVGAQKYGAPAAHGPERKVIDISSIPAVQRYLERMTGEESRLYEFRRIKRALLKNIEAGAEGGIRNPNLVAVTSAVSGEGKTYTALNLALNLTLERDRTVLLVDADVRKREITQLLGLNDMSGVTDLVVRPECELPDVLMRTSIHNLVVLPAGAYDRDAVEILSSARLGRLIEEMSQRYADRIIIFDTPPVLATVEAHVLTDMAGQVVFVVESERTLLPMVKQALAQIDNKEKAVGLVLNRYRPRFGSAGDHYYGGYY